jgi:hypothetical protein
VVIAVNVRATGLAPGVTGDADGATAVFGAVVIPAIVIGIVTAPPTGVIVRLYVAVCPACTVIVAFDVVNVNVEIVVTSVAVSFARFDSPPPETVTLFVTGPGAAAVTFTVNVITG